MMQPKIIITADGSHTLLLEEYGEHYHSTYGAINESMHVYIENGIIPALTDNQKIEILEIGFGTGLNALLTLMESANKNVSIKYTAIEAYPLDNNIIKQLNYPELIAKPSAGIQFSKIHLAPWNQISEISSHFSLNKIYLTIQDTILPSNTYHVVYFDAFAPDIQPELWTSEIFSKCFHAMKENAVLMTYSAKGNVKRALKSAGFKVINLPGPPGKREITKAIKCT